jgi:hypothetical protein
MEGRCFLAWAFGLRFPLRFFFFLRLRCASCAAAVATSASWSLRSHAMAMRRGSPWRHCRILVPRQNAAILVAAVGQASSRRRRSEAILVIFSFRVLNRVTHPRAVATRR